MTLEKEEVIALALLRVLEVFRFLVWFCVVREEVQR